jgi:hypothetical protein
LRPSRRRVADDDQRGEGEVSGAGPDLVDFTRLGHAV